MNFQGCNPYAYIVLNDKYINCDTDKLEEELTLLCKTKLPEYVCPVGMKFIDEFPYTPIGKLDFVSLENDCNNEMQKSMKKVN